MTSQRLLNDQKKAITLKGSTEIVTDFFEYAVNNILYQRGLYPMETFKKIQKYNVPLFVTSDDSVQTYLQNVLTCVKGMLDNMTIQKLILVIKRIDDEEVVERWQFNLICDKAFVDRDGKSETKENKKGEDEVRKEIQAVMRQITGSVALLPLLDFPCSFDILLYTDKNIDTPLSWNETGPALIKNGQEVRLKSFSTNIHKVDPLVAYRTDD